MNKRYNLSMLSVTLGMLFMSAPLIGAADPYDVISQKNLFRPDRQEWILDKPDGTMMDKKVDTSKLELYGTIIVGDKKNALIFDKGTNEKGAPKGRGASKRGRSTAADKKAELYALGDYIGGYVISSIKEKRVVLDYYGEKVTLYLHEGKEPTQGDVTPLDEEKPTKPKVKPRPKSAAQRAKEAKEANKAKKGQGVLEAERKKMEEQLAAGNIPEALANSPFMSQDNMKKLLEFNKEVMEELKESGGELDQSAIKDKVEKFRERFMDDMGGMMGEQ
jgi:hypothetical protein